MSARNRRACGGLAALLLVLAACERTPSPPVPAGPAAAALAGPVEPLTVGPITFFNESCARCHGSYGSNYGEALRRLGDDELTRIVGEMIVGPAMSDLSQPDTRAQVAYHRSLIDGRPFVAMTGRDASSISGEVTPGAAVGVVAGGRRVGATVTGHTWRAEIPGGGGALVIEARAGDAVTTIDPTREPHSHPRR